MLLRTLAAIDALYIVAQVGEPTSTYDWVQLGVVGAVLAALMSGLLRHRREVDREALRAEKAEQQRDKLIEVTHEKVLPTVQELVRVVQSLPPLVQELKDELRDRR
jgi:hypothetical protein